MRLAQLTLFSLLGSLTLHAQSVPSAPPVPATPLNIVVFSDFQCPYSADLFFSLQRYQQNHPGALNVIFKQSPLSIHPDSPLAHRAALAAGRQGKFDAMATILFANQQHQDLTSLLADARQLHLDMVRFRRDMDSPAVKAQLDADTNEAAAFGIDSTPTLYIRGKPLVGDLEESKLDTFLGGLPASPESLSPAVAASPDLDRATTAELERNGTAEQGNAAAPLTIVEFTDFQCPYCRAAAKPLEQFVAAHPHDVHLVVHSFPLDFHPDSELANEAALAAGEQGKFWQMHDLLFAHQDALKLASLRQYAEELHLDMAAFDSALSSHSLAGKIAADRALGMRAGVDGTPTFFIDGHSMSGARSTAEWEQLLSLHHEPSSAQPSVVAAAKTPSSSRIVTGAATAPLTLTWYTDVRSPLAPMQAELVRSLASRYDGKVRVLFKACPLAMHTDATLASAALVAAASQNKFWPMYDAITAHKAVLDRDGILTLAASLRFDTAAFATALDAASTSVQADVDEAQRRGILGAPVIFLNDQRVDGLQREAFYTAIADDELKLAVADKTVPTAPQPASN